MGAQTTWTDLIKFNACVDTLTDSPAAPTQPPEDLLGPVTPTATLCGSFCEIKSLDDSRLSSSSTASTRKTEQETSELCPVSSHNHMRQYLG